MVLSIPETFTGWWNSAPLVVAVREGLIGFPDWSNFRLSLAASNASVAVLSSLDQDDLHFLAIDPRQVAPEYATAIPAEALKELGVSGAEEALLLALLTVDGQPSRITANLLGPVVVNPVTGAARQLVLTDSPYTTRHVVAHGSSHPQPKGAAGYVSAHA